MGSAIVNLGKLSTYVGNESRCTAFKRKCTQFVENPLPPFMISRYVKLFMKSLHYLDEAFRRRNENGARVYLGESTVSFLLHEPSQSMQSTRKNSWETTAPDVSDGEYEDALHALRQLPGFVDGSGAAQEIFSNILG